jgi:hypothetical protein
MAIKYEFNPEQHYVLTKAIGHIELTDILDYIDKLISDPLLNKPYVEIVDFSEINDFNFGYYESSWLIDKLKHLESLNNYEGTILIADRAFTPGMTNMFQVVGDSKAINIKIVSNLEDAYSEVNERFS